MTMQLQEWIQHDASLHEEMLEKYRKRTNKKIIIGIIVCIVGFIALGTIAGAPPKTVMTMHLPIGVGAAILYALIYVWDKSRMTQKHIVKVYTKGAKRCFTTEQEELDFVRGMKSEDATKFYSYWKTDPFDRMFMISKEYMVYLSFSATYFVKLSNIEKVSTEGIFMKVNNHKEGIGTAMEIQMKPQGNKRKGNNYRLVFANDDDLSEAVHLMKVCQPDLVIE